MQHIKTLCRLTAIAAVLFLHANSLRAVEPLDADALRQTLDRLIDEHPTAKRTTVTLKVIDLATGEVLYDRGGSKLLIPASNLKIYTAAAAYDLLGPDYRWKTEVLSTAKIKRGVCKGDLLIRGTGDPMLNTEGLASLADALVDDHHLRAVRGSVKVETSARWGKVPLKGPGWMWDDDPDAYNMSIRSVMLNFNTLDVVVRPGKLSASVSLDPKSDWPPVSASTPNKDAEPVVRVTRQPFHEPIRVTGNPTADSQPVRKTITMHDPSLWIAAVFKQMLIDRGVEFRGEPTTPSGARKFPIVSYESQTLAQALHHFLKTSENAVGEMVLLKLAETQTQDVVSWSAGAKTITDWLINTAGLEEGSFRIVDGSGLSRYSLISADSSVKLLAFMKTHKYFDAFYDGLRVYKVPLPENDTWDSTPLNTFDQQRVYAKPGGMSGVSSISGYVQTLDGRWLVFSLLSNGYIGPSKPVLGLRPAVWAELIRFRASESQAD